MSPTAAIPAPAPGPIASKPVRERIFEVARDLFYRRGIRAVGVETIVAEAGTTKMSLYRHFPSKEDLVVAYLTERNQQYWRWWDETMAQHPGDARRQIHDYFTWVASRVTKPGYRGCPMTNAAVEFPEPDHPGRAVSAAHKRELQRRLRELSARAGASNPDELGDSLFLLVEGAYASSQTAGATGPLMRLVAAADTLVAAALD